MGPDLDVCELHLSIKNGLTGLPYITADGQTSLNMPYESIDVTDVMFEAHATDLSTAKVVLPSLIPFPALRGLLQQIRETDRVELFAFQPDCGDPIFAGFIAQEGITEQDGKVSLEVQDPLVQLRWNHLRRIETLVGSAAALYKRAISRWADLVTEDFLGTNPAGDYTVVAQTPGSPVLTWGGGFVKQTNGAGDYIYPTNVAAQTVQIGDSWLMEADVTINHDYVSNIGNGQVIAQLGLTKLPIIGTSGFVCGFLEYQPTGVPATPHNQECSIEVFPNGGLASYDPTFGGLQISGTKQTFPMPQSHHLAVYMNFVAGAVTVYVFLDNINVAIATSPWFFDSTGYVPFANLQTSEPSSPEFAKLTTWRVSKLSPTLIPAARFNPQTTDSLSYQPNNEENLQFLQLIAEKDNAEFRPVYHAWPAIDELEIDQAGTLGKFASRVLGYEQPPRLPTEGSPQASPAPVIQDVASFLTAPPFRFEEGYNLEAAPKTLSRANAHANDVIRVGASSMDSQTFAEKWSAAELGRPQHNPSGAVYPRIEQITNDDRVGIQSVVASLAGLELARRTDPTPSLELAVVDEIPWAFRWRAGDQVLVRTLSLRNNVEQELRVQRIQYKAGSPVRTVTMGKTDFDPTQMRAFSEDMMISWLYEQSGTNPGTYVYPSLGNISSGATSAAFTIPLDKFTTGSALVYAAVHWLTDANVMNIQPVINGLPVYTTGLVGTSGTDSGLVIVTQYFQAPGTYTLAFKNNDAATRNLTGGFLILRIKA